MNLSVANWNSEALGDTIFEGGRRCLYRTLPPCPSPLQVEATPWPTPEFALHRFCPISDRATCPSARRFCLSLSKSLSLSLSVSLALKLSLSNKLLSLPQSRLSLSLSVSLSLLSLPDPLSPSFLVSLPSLSSLFRLSSTLFFSQSLLFLPPSRLSSLALSLS